MGTYRTHRAALLLGLLPLAAACATTTGPRVTSEEERAAIEELRERARVFRLEQWGRIWDVGYALIARMPESEGHNDLPFLGVLTLDAVPDDARPRALQAPRDSGVVLAHVVRGLAADRAGLRRGDRIVRVNDRRVGRARELHDAVADAAGRGPQVRAVRLSVVDSAGRGRVLEVVPDVPRRFVPFYVLPDDVVNAGTDGRNVGVTRGMLRFVKNDDELAVVLGHELAHITRNHLGERVGRGLGWALFGLLVSAAVGADVTDLTDLAAAIAESKFSRDQEREADVVGLRYAHAAGYDIRAGVSIWERFAIELPESLVKFLFASHPTSAERMVRARKIAEEIAAGGEPAIP